MEFETDKIVKAKPNYPNLDLYDIWSKILLQNEIWFIRAPIGIEINNLSNDFECFKYIVDICIANQGMLFIRFKPNLSMTINDKMFWKMENGDKVILQDHYNTFATPTELQDIGYSRPVYVFQTHANVIENGERKATYLENFDCDLIEDERWVLANANRPNIRKLYKRYIDDRD